MESLSLTAQGFALWWQRWISSPMPGAFLWDGLIWPIGQAKTEWQT
jgi:hypothetical protein